MNKQKNDRFTFHQNGMIQKIETVPVRRDGRNPLPVVVQIVDAIVVAAFFVVVAWVTWLIMSGGGDMFAGLMVVAITKSVLIKALEPLDKDAQIVILIDKRTEGHDEFGYTQYNIVAIDRCSLNCHCELVAGEVVGFG